MCSVPAFACVLERERENPRGPVERVCVRGARRTLRPFSAPWSLSVPFVLFVLSHSGLALYRAVASLVAQ